MKPIVMHLAIAAAMTAAPSVAFAITDITNNTALDNIVIQVPANYSKTLTSKVKGTSVCNVKGEMEAANVNGNQTMYVGGYSILTAVPPGRPTPAFPKANENYGTYSAGVFHMNFTIPVTGGAGTCVYTLDTDNSKFVVNQLGIGLAELNWVLYNPNNTTGITQSCFATIKDQMGFTFQDAAGKTVITSHINDADSQFFSEQNATCTKR